MKAKRMETFATVEEPTTTAEVLSHIEKHGRRPTNLLAFNVREVAGGAHLIWKHLDRKLARTEVGPQRRACIRFYSAYRAWHDGDVSATDHSRPYVDEGSHQYGSTEATRSQARQDYRDAVAVLTDREKAIVYSLLVNEQSFRDMAKRWPRFGGQESARKEIARIFYGGMDKLIDIWGLGA